MRARGGRPRPSGATPRGASDVDGRGGGGGGGRGGHASFEAKARAAASGSVASPVSRARERRHATPRASPATSALRPWSRGYGFGTPLAGRVVQPIKTAARGRPTTLGTLSRGGGGPCLTAAVHALRSRRSRTCAAPRCESRPEVTRGRAAEGFLFGFLICFGVFGKDDGLRGNTGRQQVAKGGWRGKRRVPRRASHPGVSARAAPGRRGRRCSGDSRGDASGRGTAPRTAAAPCLNSDSNSRRSAWNVSSTARSFWTRRAGEGGPGASEAIGEPRGDARSWVDIAPAATCVEPPRGNVLQPRARRPEAFFFFEKHESSPGRERRVTDPASGRERRSRRLDGRRLHTPRRADPLRRAEARAGRARGRENLARRSSHLRRVEKIARRDLIRPQTQELLSCAHPRRDASAPHTRVRARVVRAARSPTPGRDVRPRRCFASPPRPPRACVRAPGFFVSRCRLALGAVDVIARATTSRPRLHLRRPSLPSPRSTRRWRRHPRRRRTSPRRSGACTRTSRAI